jgi:hypothetical protein
MHDPNGIALNASDVDLGVYQEAAGDGGASDLMDYGALVGQWGEETGGVLAASPTSAPSGCPPSFRRRAAFHPSHQITLPFIVSAVVAALILIVVFFPREG